MKAFSRSIMIFNALAAALSVSDPLQREMELQAVPTYTSRGKGRALGPQRPSGATWRTRHHNNALVAVGTQGKRERERRVRQMQRGVVLSVNRGW